MGRKWSYSTYGKSALGISVNLTGLDKYLEKIQAAGNSINDACKDAVNAALPIVEKSMKAGAERHRRTGDVVNAIETVPAKQEGNYIYGTVGIDMEKHPEAKEGVFQEYGDGHSPEFPDPFVRPAIDDNQKTVKKIMRGVLKKRGVPIDGAEGYAAADNPGR
jgi:HK97 gp10 family phage protein